MNLVSHLHHDVRNLNILPSLILHTDLKDHILLVLRDRPLRDEGHELTKLHIISLLEL